MDENQNIDQTPEQNAAEIIANLKANSVSKESYQKVVNENRQLMEALANGQMIDQAEEVRPEIDPKKLTDDIFFGELNNLEYARKALEMREYMLENKGIDIFIAQDPMAQPTQEKIMQAQNVAQVLQECIDNAQGDSAIFRMDLQRRCVDPIILNGR